MNKKDVYKCNLCGNVVEVLEAGGGSLVCCGQPMEALEGQTADFANEKHVPMIEKIENGYKVIVGSTAHPMAEDHYIEWIELVTATGTLIEFLNPGDAPEAVFKTDAKPLFAREYCNKHGLWKTK